MHNSTCDFLLPTSCFQKIVYRYLVIEVVTYSRFLSISQSVVNSSYFQSIRIHIHPVFQDFFAKVSETPNHTSHFYHFSACDYSEY